MELCLHLEVPRPVVNDRFSITPMIVGRHYGWIMFTVCSFAGNVRLCGRLGLK